MNGRLNLDLEPAKAIDRPAAPTLPLFDDWSRAERGLAGVHDGQPVEMFDLTTVDRGPDSDSEQGWTVVLFRNVPLPEFDCLPKTWLTLPFRALSPAVVFPEDLADFADRQTVRDFNAAYQLQPHFTAESQQDVDEDALRRLFRPAVLDLLANRPGWRVQAAKGYLAVAKQGFASAGERARLWDDAVEIRRGLLSTAEGGTVIPTDPRQSVSLQRRRMVGRGVGGFVGAITGFFGGFILFSMIMIANPQGPQAGFTPDFFFPFPFGGLFLGALLGVAVGGWWAERTHNREAPRPPVAHPARAFGPLAICGAMAGWMLGGLCGIGILLLLVPLGLPHWLAPVLMFGPALPGLLLGGYAGHRLSQWRTARLKQPRGDGTQE